MSFRVGGLYQHKRMTDVLFRVTDAEDGLLEGYWLTRLGIRLSGTDWIKITNIRAWKPFKSEGKNQDSPIVA